MQIGIANGIPLNDVITGDDLVPAYDQSTGTEGYVNLTTAVQKAFSGSVAGTANGVLYLDGSKVATSGSALTFDGTGMTIGAAVSASTRLTVNGPVQFNASTDTNTYVGLQNTAYLTASGSMVFGANSSEQMRLTSTGLGIGTSSPAYKLVVSNGGASGIEFGPAFSGTSNLMQSYNRSGAAYVNMVYDAAEHRFNISGSERLRIDSNGNLGLGVTPSAWGSSSRALQVFTYSALYDFSSGYNGLAGNARHDGSTWKYITTNRAISYEQSVAEGNHKWYTALSGTAGDTISFTQAMTLDASGNLLVGTTSSSSIAAGGVVLGNLSNAIGGAVSGGILTKSGVTTTSYVGVFSNPNGAVGSITIAGSTTAYNTSSDYRLKDITGPVTNSGAYIDSLNPVEGTWKADGSTFVGLIAHEVQEVSRTSIATGVKDGEEMQAMDYSSAELIANLIAEVKSLRARVAALEA